MASWPFGVMYERALSMLSKRQAADVGDAVPYTSSIHASATSHILVSTPTDLRESLASALPLPDSSDHQTTTNVSSCTPASITTVSRSSSPSHQSLPAEKPEPISAPKPLSITTLNTSPSMTAQEDLTRAASTLQSLLRKPSNSTSAEDINKALSTAKRVLLTHNLLLPNPAAPPPAHAAARFILESSSLLSIRAQDPDAFTRYYAALQPFYELPASSYPQGEARGQKSKVTGLFLMLLLTKGDYAGFHTLLETLEAEEERGGKGVEGDAMLRYPVMLERWLMEGSYDRVWGATKGEGLPGEDFAVFSQILVGTIREEIASCSEKAYPSIPISNAKNLLFLPSEGAVVQFAQERGWQVKDSRIYFPEQGVDTRNEKEILVSSGQVIENTIGYARELETIV